MSHRPPRPAPSPFRWTVEQYQQLDKTHLFHELKTMPVDGVFYVSPSADPPHDYSVGVASDWLWKLKLSGFHSRCQMGFVIGNDTDANPDLALVPGEIRASTNAHPTTAALSIEVADSSLNFDTTTKAEKNATAGVPDYWVLDLTARELVIFRAPNPLPAGLGATAYRQRNTFGPAASVSPLAATAATITVADLLP
jgi:Uma2 family endonuclease